MAESVESSSPPEEASLLSLLRYYNLKDEVCNQPVMDRHIEKISRSYCSQWRSLPSHLDLLRIVVHDIELTHSDEEKRRFAFFCKWKELKGRKATYRTLIEALLEIKSVDDAETVCKLLQQSVAKQQLASASSKGGENEESPEIDNSTLPDDEDPVEDTIVKKVKNNQNYRAGFCSDHHTEELKVYCQTCKALICLRCVIRGEGHHDHTYELLQNALANTDLLSKVQNRPDSTNCYAEGKGIQGATVHIQATATVEINNFERQPCEDLDESLECELASEERGDRVKCTVERIGPNQYKITYTPSHVGQHQLGIKVGGQHIKGSPFSITAKSPIKQLGTPILTIKGVAGPCGVAISQSQEIVVAEWHGNCVSVFSKNGKKLRSFGFSHNSKVSGVAVDAKGNILVADFFNHCIHKLSARGKLLNSVGSKGSGHLEFCFPTDVAFNPSNDKLYVADWSNDRIQVLESNLTFFSVFGCECLKKPRSIACGSNGKVYVADRGNHCIRIFTAEGEYDGRIQQCDSSGETLDWPNDVVVDSNGLVYVSEGRKTRVSIYNTSQNEFVSAFGKMGCKPGEFNRPYGLAVDKSRRLYVCDLMNNCIQVFL